MAAAPLTRRRTVSVRFLGLADHGTRGSAHGGTHRPGDNSSGDRAGRGPLFNVVAAGGGREGCNGKHEGNGGAFHGDILQMAEFEREPLPPVPALRGKLIVASAAQWRQ
jgi:hypothetical protein